MGMGQARPQVYLGPSHMYGLTSSRHMGLTTGSSRQQTTCIKQRTLLLFMGTACFGRSVRQEAAPGRQEPSSPPVAITQLPGWEQTRRKAERERGANNISVGINDFSWYPAEGSHPFRWLRSSTSRPPEQRTPIPPHGAAGLLHVGPRRVCRPAAPVPRRRLRLARFV
jgi:hypothetical protein